jgi:hypothetical protein
MGPGGFSLGHFLIQGGTSLREPINPKDDKSSGARRVHRVATRIRVKTSTIANSPQSPSRVERAFLPARAAEAAVGVPVPRSSSLSEGVRGLSKGESRRGRDYARDTDRVINRRRRYGR